MAHIKPTAHAAIDYVAGAALLLAPFVFGMAPTTATMVLQVVGAATIVSSLITDYRLSVAKLIPYRIHLLLDVALGLVMLAVAWLATDGGTAQALLLAAGIIYVVVPVLSMPSRSS